MNLLNAVIPHITLIFEDGRTIDLQALGEDTIYAARSVVRNLAVP